PYKISHNPATSTLISAFSGIPQTKKEKILPHLFSLSSTPQPHTSFSHSRSNINVRLRISDRKTTEILEIKKFHHRFQQKCYQPTTSPYLILQTLIKSSVLISRQYKNYPKIARTQKYYSYCINNRNT
ncbi:hypothetical protein MGQ_04239, partial [Candida albicans P76067]